MTNPNIWAPGTALTVDSTVKTESFVATAGQTLFELSNFSYYQNTGSLFIFVSGILQRVTYDWVETSSTSFTLNTPIEEDGTIVYAVGFVEIQSGFSDAERAEAAAALAEDWATETGGPVSGTDYSAKYYAQLTATYVSTAENAATAAAASETAAGISETNAGNSETAAAASAALAALTANSIALQWEFSDTTAMADPGTGLLRLNHATPASVTAIAISALSADTGNPDVSDYVATWDDSTNTDKGTLLVKNDGTVHLYSITAVADNGTWLQLAVTPVAVIGTFTDAQATFATFARSGNKGADGVGAGDVVGPAGATDSQIVLFDGSTGKAIKAATTTGLLKAASGVIAAAVAGTDYLEPSAITNMLVTGDIDVSVQGYDAATAKTDAEQTWSEVQRTNENIGTSLTLDLDAAYLDFRCTPSAGGALTFSNIPASPLVQKGTIVFINGSNYAITAHANTKVTSTLLATISATGTYLINYRTSNGVVYLTTAGAQA
jgi:hypothetical protein